MFGFPSVVSDSLHKAHSRGASFLERLLLSGTGCRVDSLQKASAELLKYLECPQPVRQTPMPAMRRIGPCPGGAGVFLKAGVLCSISLPNQYRATPAAILCQSGALSHDLDNSLFFPHRGILSLLAAKGSNGWLLNGGSNLCSLLDSFCFPFNKLQKEGSLFQETSISRSVQHTFTHKWNVACSRLTPAAPLSSSASRCQLSFCEG